jgi:hypothetical protein
MSRPQGRALTYSVAAINVSVKSRAYYLRVELKEHSRRVIWAKRLQQTLSVSLIGWSLQERELANS